MAIIKKKILLLDDELDVIDAFDVSIPNIELTIVNNLLEFNRQLFDDPGFEAFHRVFIDLAIRMPNIPINIIRKKLPKLFEVNGTQVPITQINGISLMGLDFFTRIILKDVRDTPSSIDKFIFFTGHGALLKQLISENKIEGIGNVKIIAKRGKGLYEEINSLL